jgi:uncharacterized membrane protein YbhN (UPF0104 family)
MMVVNNLPITAMGLGTREALVIFFFSQYGSTESLLSTGVLVSLIEHVLPVTIGLFFIRPFIEYFKENTRR